MSIKIVASLTVCSVIAVSAIAFWLCRSRSGFPPKWQAITAGMSRQEVITAIGAEPNSDLRDEKGYEMYWYRPNANENWSLLVHYDSDNRWVKRVSFHYVDRNIGWRNIIVSAPDDAFKLKYAEKGLDTVGAAPVDPEHSMTPVATP